LTMKLPHATKTPLKHAKEKAPMLDQLLRNQQVARSIRVIGSKIKGLRTRRSPFSLIWLPLVATLLLSCGGGGGPTAPGSVPDPEPTLPASIIAEQSDYYDGVTWHRYFRYDIDGIGHVGYAWSNDGLHFDRYPDPIMEGLFPILVQDGEHIYLIVNQGSSYNLYNVSVKTRPAFVRTVMVGDYLNVGAAVREGRWHMLVEVKDGTRVHLKYTWSDWPDLDFAVNMGDIVFADAGNPCLRYIPERDAILAFFGEYPNGPWQVGCATFDFTDWTKRGFVLASAGVHLADPDLGVGVESSPLILTVGYAQDSVSSYRFEGSKLGLYDAIVAGHVEVEEIGVTMRP
jgi:hypothetical protein